jgi:hypothetical protein
MHSGVATSSKRVPEVHNDYLEFGVDAEEGFGRLCSEVERSCATRELVINLENCRMYDRDYVKSLEQEIELSGGNRFEGWCLSTEKGNTPESKQPEQRTETAQEPAHR